MIRVFPQRTCRSFYILFSQCSCDIGRNQAVLCHFLRFHPNTHTIRITQELYISYSLNTFYLWNYIYIQIIGQKTFIITFIRTDKAINLQITILTFCRTDTNCRYFCRQQSLSCRYTILYIDSCHIRICSLSKINQNFSRTSISRSRSNVNHVFHTIYTLFQRHDNTVHHSICIGSCISRIHTNCWRSNIRILFYRQYIK